MRKSLPSTPIAPMGAKRFLRASMLCFNILLGSLLTSGQSQLIRDLNTDADNLVFEYSELTDDGKGNLYFISEGKNLYKTNTNESPQHTVLLRVLRSISDLTVVGNNVFFVGEDGAGKELWKTNGTGATTRRVKEIRAGSAGSNPANLANINGILFFAANDGVNGTELWKSDGTDGGTVRIKDINPGAGDSNPAWITEVNGIGFFAANDGKRGNELWKSDGTSSGTVIVEDILCCKTSASSDPAQLTNLNGTLFFVASGQSKGRELWKSLGSAASTSMVHDINPGYHSSDVRNLIAMGDHVYFSAMNPTHKHQLWKSNGSTTSMITTTILDYDIEHSYPFEHFAVIENHLYYRGISEGRFYIFRSDGTANGTMRFGGELFDGHDPNFSAIDGVVYYLGTGFDEEEYTPYLTLNRINAEAGNATMVRRFPFEVDISGEIPGIVPQMINVNNSLYLTVILEELEGWVLARSNGTAEGTVYLKDTYNPTRSSNPDRFVVHNGLTYMIASTGANQQLWRTDGTAGGTIMLKSMHWIFDVKSIGGVLYFIGSPWIGFDAAELWKTDGTESGTVLLKAFPIEYNSWNVNLTDVYGTTYFSPGLGELWKSNGTAAGTIRLKTFNEIGYIGYGGGRAIFSVKTAGGEFELWRSSGTANSTAKLKTINNGSSFRFNGPRTTVGDIFYFVGDDGVHGEEVWRSNGTTSGTFMMADVGINDINKRDILHMIVHNDSLYFIGRDQYSSDRLYKSNGTAQGTIALQSSVNSVNGMISYGDQLLLIQQNRGTRQSVLLSTNGQYNGPRYVTHLLEDPIQGNVTYAIVNDVVFFSQMGALWRTDGRECGTRQIKNVQKNVYPLIANGNDLIFGANDPKYGVEPHRMSVLSDPGDLCWDDETTNASASATSMQAASGLTYGPNPFTHELTFRIEGNEGEAVTVQVKSFTGEVIETLQDLRTNTDYPVGISWPRGLYVLNVTANGKAETVRVVKK